MGRKIKKSVILSANGIAANLSATQFVTLFVRSQFAKIDVRSHSIVALLNAYPLSVKLNAQTSTAN